MPDWSYHPLKKGVLDYIPAKTSRDFLLRAMGQIATTPGGRSLIRFLGHMSPPEPMKKQLFNITFPSPIGLSSSLIDPHLSGLAAFQELGFGFVEIGPIVLREPQEQNAPTMHNNHIAYAQQQEKLQLKHALNKLTALPSHIPIIASIDSHITRTEYRTITQHLTPYVDAFIISSQQLSEFNNVELPACPLLLACSAEEATAPELVQLAMQRNVAGVVLQPPKQRLENSWHEAKHTLEYFITTIKKLKTEHPELIIITSGGVATPDDAYELIEAGADLIMLTEGYVHAGPGLPKRIHERLMYDEANVTSSTKQAGWHWSLLFGLSILIGGMIALYFAFTSIILPYDEAFIGLTRADLLQLNPRILSFMSHDRMALAGTMISGGILYIQLARHGLRRGMHWARIAFHSAAIIGFLGILLFIGYGYFDWLHGLFWLILLPFYYASYKEGKTALAVPCSKHGHNDRAWQLANYGQLMFVMLGFAILIGGIVISTIGVSRVFVSTDISYLCMSPEMLDSINSKLIPVIAHDRAGFGSALVSVGMLVLMLSLWGFRQGERWVWNTLAVGALPAFIAGIGTHFYIGYTTFIHLLPVYFLIALYALGLVLTYPHLKGK